MGIDTPLLHHFFEEWVQSAKGVMDGSRLAARPARAPKTSPSSSELLARRFAP
jgi:hypothetical protein